MADDEQQGGGHVDERWIVSYADFITTLFALFVLLYAVAISSANDRVKIWRAMAAALGAKPLMGGERPQLNNPISKGSRPTVKKYHDHALARAQRALEASLSQYPVSGVSLIADEHGLTIRLAASPFFASGQADINPAEKPALDLIVAPLVKLPNPLRIEGFTDSIPISNNRFADNWDLSAARAANVLRYIVDHCALPASRLSLAGYGPYHPVAGNDTEQERARNRRVDIVIPALSRPPLEKATANAR
jgi:chemotaxis protein MotB